MKAIIVAALLAMASPAWAQQVIGPSPGFLNNTWASCVEGYTYRAGDGCVHPTSTTGTEHPVEYPDIPIKGCWPTCIAGGGPALSSPKCDPGYALLAYPGTWTLVCARDLQAPK